MGESAGAEILPHFQAAERSELTVKWLNPAFPPHVHAHTCKPLTHTHVACMHGCSIRMCTDSACKKRAWHTQTPLHTVQRETRLFATMGAQPHAPRESCTWAYVVLLSFFPPPPHPTVAKLTPVSLCPRKT